MSFKPRLVLEVGSGISTKTAHRALNELPDPATRKHICIEPYRDDVIEKTNQGSITIEIFKKTIQEMDKEIFTTLQPNDLFFIDSSHVTQAFGDTILELVFILPTLPVGVIVHIHDICLPENYPTEWLDQNNGKADYTEQFVLAAFLYGNTKWKVLWANWYMGIKQPQLFRDIGLPGEKHGAIFIQKIA